MTRSEQGFLNRLRGIDSRLGLVRIGESRWKVTYNGQSVFETFRLDEGTIRRLREMDVTRYTKRPGQRVDEHNDRIESAKQRDLDDTIEQISKDLGRSLTTKVFIP